MLSIKFVRGGKTVICRIDRIVALMVQSINREKLSVHQKATDTLHCHDSYFVQ